MIEFFSACAVPLATIAVAVIEARASLGRKTAETAAEIRRRETLLAMRLTAASVDLAVATAEAVRDGKTDGKMAGAIQEAEKARAEYRGFLAEAMTKNL